MLVAILVQYLIVHLFRAVEHIHHDAKGPPKVLGGLSLAGAGWTSRGSTHGQVEGLGEGDVAPGGQQRVCTLYKLDTI